MLYSGLPQGLLAEYYIILYYYYYYYCSFSSVLLPSAPSSPASSSLLPASCSLLPASCSCFFSKLPHGIIILYYIITEADVSEGRSCQRRREAATLLPDGKAGKAVTMDSWADGLDGRPCTSTSPPSSFGLQPKEELGS